MPICGHGETAAHQGEAGRSESSRCGLSLGTTESAVLDVIAALGNPHADPRDSRTPPVLKRRMLRLED